jgi:hypothetical protein
MLGSEGGPDREPLCRWKALEQSACGSAAFNSTTDKEDSCRAEFPMESSIGVYGANRRLEKQTRQRSVISVQISLDAGTRTETEAAPGLIVRVKFGG